MNLRVFWKYIGYSAIVVCGLVVFDKALQLGIHQSYFVGLLSGLVSGAYWKALE